MPSFPGGNNTFIPSFEASGKLQIEFSRNPESFPLNRYVGIKTVDKSIGRYLNITAEEATRIANQADYTWSDGQDAPGGMDGTEDFSFRSFTTERFAFPFRIGDKAIQQADWDVLASHARIHAQKAMTNRTLSALDILTTIASWPTNNTDTAANLGGGFWSAATSTNQFILKTMDSVKEKIHLATQGAVPPEALRMVVSPKLAHTMRETDEIIDYVKQNATALQTIAGNQFFERWGVPNMLYGVKLVVEDTVITTSRKGATAVRDYEMKEQEAFFTAVTEGLENSREPAEGAPTFNTCTAFVFEDMTIESRRDDDNRLINARVVDDFAIVLTAGASGFLITEVVAP